MNIIFRVDASLEIGTGHVMRCLTLANTLTSKGAKCQFICREHSGNLSDLIAQQGHEIQLLSNDRYTTLSKEGDLAHSKWLGASWTSDADQTKRAIREKKIDWLIVDHYALDQRWETELRPYSKKIMVIDDLTDRMHDCDLLLNQNYGSSSANYQSLVPEHCIQLHGPEFALLKPIYAARRENLRVRNGVVSRILVYFGGGSDPDDLTGMTVQAFSAPELKSIAIDVVVGSGYAHMAELVKIASRHGRLTIHTRLPDLAALMESADLAVGAGGATTWERCCMGLPCMVISVADNQRPACEALEKSRLIQYIGSAESISVDKIRSAAMQLIRQPAQLQQLSKNSLALVDGQGTVRVIDALDAESARIFKSKFS